MTRRGRRRSEPIHHSNDAVAETWHVEVDEQSGFEAAKLQVAKKLCPMDAMHDRYGLQFDDEAQEFFQSWLTELETYLRSGELQNAAVESHLSKYRSLMPSLALIFHLLRRVTKESDRTAIQLDTAQPAAAWCSYLQKHAEKLYRTALMSDFDGARAILQKINNGELEESFSARDIYSKHWKNLSDPQEVIKGLEILSEYRHLLPVQRQTGGRTKTVYVVNKSEPCAITTPPTSPLA